MKKYVYKITNLVNGKIYIGQSIDYLKRFKQHCSGTKEYTSLISQAIKKYGEENFIVEKLYYGKYYNEKEQYFIKKLNSLIPNGYNLAPGGEEPPREVDGKKVQAKLTYELVSQIQQDLLSSLTLAEVQDKYVKYITRGQINRINVGDAWYNDELSYPLNTRMSTKVCEKDIPLIIEEILTTRKTLKEIGQEYGYCKSTIVNINQGNKPQYNFPQYSYPLRQSVVLHCKLSKKLVEKITEEILYTEKSYYKIGKEFGVTKDQVKRISQGKVTEYILEGFTYPLRNTTCNDYPSEGE